MAFPFSLPFSQPDFFSLLLCLGTLYLCCQDLPMSTLLSLREVDQFPNFTLYPLTCSGVTYENDP